MLPHQLVLQFLGESLVKDHIRRRLPYDQPGVHRRNHITRKFLQKLSHLPGIQSILLVIPNRVRQFKIESQLLLDVRNALGNAEGWVRLRGRLRGLCFLRFPEPEGAHPVVSKEKIVVGQDEIVQLTALLQRRHIVGCGDVHHHGTLCVGGKLCVLKNNFSALFFHFL